MRSSRLFSEFYESCLEASKNLNLCHDCPRIISLFFLYQFFRGSLPLLTKGSLAKFFGGPKVIKQLSNDPPSPAVLVFFIYSILIQIAVVLYKKIRKYQLRTFQTYIQELRTNLGMLYPLTNPQISFKMPCLVNNVVNMYGTMVLITITGVSTFIIISHLRDIDEEVKGGKKMTGSLVPEEWFIMIGFTIICVFLPFVKSHALRFELFKSKIQQFI